jgi:DNA (cytosine-5)-methyltransferase 1
MCKGILIGEKVKEIKGEININKPQLINFCEFDKYAVQSYCAVHNVNSSLNLGDITKVNEKEIADFNMMTWGFPCVDISVAGKQKGFIDEEGNKTRSGMYYEGIRILREKKPALSIVENVKALTSKKFKNEFDMVLKDLDEAGYNTYWQILNAKDYGIPQNRERVFLISIRKDLDNGKFVFPKGFDNGLRLKDLLDKEVDKKYYLSKDKLTKFLSDTSILSKLSKSENNVNIIGTVDGKNFNQKKVIYNPNCISGTLIGQGHCGNEPKIVCGIDKSYNNPELIENANCITAREDRGISNRKAEGTAVIETNRCIQTGDLNYYNFDTTNRVYSKDGISPTLQTLQTLQGGNRQPKILEDFYSNRDVGEYTDYSPTLRSERNGLKVTDNSSFKVRKLTPKECWRLMGFSSEQFDKAKSVGVSDSQLYKQAGNSIVTYVLYEIYKELYKVMPYLFDDIKLSSFFSGIGAFEIALDMFYNYIITGEEQNFIKPQMD